MSQKQVANVERRTWDVETYEKKAAARRQNEQVVEEDAGASASQSDKAEFQAAPAGAVGPEGSQRAFLQARSSRVVDIDERVGATTMISVEAAASSTSASDGVKKTGVGWHCTVCDCFLKDSLTYLDHINGRKHQRKLGYSMRVERSTEADLVAKLNELEQTASRQDPDETTILSLDEMVKQKDEQEQRRKEERQRKRKERKKLAKDAERNVPLDEPITDDQVEPSNPQSVDEVGEEDDEHGGLDPAMAAMMGFSGFGGGNKNR